MRQAAPWFPWRRKLRGAAGPELPSEPHYRLVGAVPTVGGIAAAFSKALGVELRYVNADEQDWRERALTLGWSTHAVEHLSRLWQVFGNPEIRRGEAYHVTDAVERVTGSRPETLEEFLRANREALLDGAPR